ncbi:ATP-dependent RecD-like DNA helicase [Propionicimonas sp. T2.31MG-18]|uniref:MobF family relaxase n=1 Tax=Propionicimonas sp. T2.31MG-18 TaxID=3157620 RepID=UPI0035EB31ED
MAIALKKLSAGSGYEYLTRTVAALDATGRGHTTLADYYTAKGETPGTWWGAGLGGVGLAAGDRVGEEQMKLLFGAGLNPTTGEQLGRRYSVFGNEPTPFEAEVAQRLQAWQDAHEGGRPGRAVCRQVRTQLGREWFTAEHGVAPEGPRELHGFIARSTSHPRVAVAGFDATFSPPKSVSALWALAPRPLAAAIRAAHEAAVTDALAEAEARVLFTRTGHRGARNVPVTGMIAARFDHRDSRAGDPDLHTHVSIANKVRTGDGHWMTIDAAVLYAAKVTLSEVYLTSLTARLRDIGLTLLPVGKEGKRPVFEIAGVDPRLNARWSSRRHRITAATSTLVAQFEADHERPPTPIEKLDLAQQATLDTRPGKHQPRSEADQRATWAAEAEQAVGQGGLDRLLHAVWSQPKVAPPVVDEAWISHTAQQLLTAMEADRSSWTPWNVRSEALRQVRAAAIPLNRIPDVVDRVVGHALTTAESVPIRTRRTMPVEPDLLRRPDTTSMYDKPSATRYTSRRILWAERRLIDTAGRLGGRVADHNTVTLALLQSMANREPLNPGQQVLVRDMATSGRRLQLAIAPAGTGKTTAMRALATAWTSSGGTIIGLAPSAAAAEQLRTQLGEGVAADNLAKLVWAINHHEPLATGIGPDTLVIIDEAGMADTLTLDHIVTWCLDQGASIRLVGDDQQLGAIGAGGVLRDIATEHGALRLDQVMRFADPAEADASLALRTGDTGALGYYLDHGRIHVVDPDTATTHLLSAWQADRAAGLDALMLAPTREQVAQLNHAARAARLHGQRTSREVELSDGNNASIGDTVITRRNNRTLTTGETAWVRNGDRWHVTKVHRDGSLDVQHLRNRNQLTLPAGYVTESVELGYATTIHGAQGVTADTCHGLLTGEESRQQAYTMLTRGRHTNHAWIQATGTETHLAPLAQELLEPATATSILETVIARDDAPASATTLLAQADQPARLLGPAATCYLDAISYAAQHHLPPHVKDTIDAAGKAHGLTDADAWPTLRSNLMLLAANGHNPTDILNRALALGGMETARDRAAVISYRLDLTQASAGRTRGPLPWLPGIPTQLLDDPYWKTYLSDRYQLTRQLWQETHHTAQTAQTPPRWAGHLPRLDPTLLADIEVWRAANQISDNDLRPTGPPAYAPAEHDTQRHLDHRLETAQAGIREWAPRITTASPEVAGDPRLAILAARLATLSKTRADIPELLTQAAAQGHLPDDHPADALGYRITTLTKKTARAHEPWETITPGDLERRRHHQPPSMHPPGHSPGISI